MDVNRKKQLLWEYKNQKPEMGIISYRCIPTGDIFLGKSSDTKTGFNSTTAKLSANWHPNKMLLDLWNMYGVENFELTVLEVLSYNDTGEKEDYTSDLEELLLMCLEREPAAKRIWK